jgi:hypothetical protein
MHVRIQVGEPRFSLQRIHAPDLKKALTSDPQALTAMGGYYTARTQPVDMWIDSAKKQRLEAAASSGTVQALLNHRSAAVFDWMSGTIMRTDQRYRSCKVV